MMTQSSLDQFLDRLASGTESGAASTGFAMNADAHFDLRVAELEIRLAGGGDGA